MRWLEEPSTWQLILLIVVAVVVVTIGSALLTAVTVRRGLRTPRGLRLINRLSDRVVSVVKRPITVMVLDEVVEVIRTGHYTQNVSSAIVENHEQLKALAAEKIREDPNIRLLGRLPGYDKIVGEVTETTLRVLIAMLGDPRMDELVSDVLRNNIAQIKVAVRDRENEHVEGFRAPGR